MADVEACDPTEELVVSQHGGKNPKVGLIISASSEISGETDIMTSEHRRGEPSTMSIKSAAPVSELEKTAEKILKYTGLSGKRLGRKMEDFTRCNRGMLEIMPN